MRLADFEGEWAVERRIADARTGRPGRFRGRARFAPDAAGLVYDEEGLLSLAGGPDYPAARRYVWRAGGAGAIDVLFADGRFFHSFEPDAPRPESAHDCPPDLYRVRYDFSLWPRWTAEWRVAGPRKDYAMVTTYSREPET